MATTLAFGCCILVPAVSTLLYLTVFCVLCGGSFDIMVDWSLSHAELFPGAVTVDAEELELLLQEVKSEQCHPFTRYEAAKSLKDLCQYQQNRAVVANDHKQQLIDGLDAMLKDDNEDIVRFAIFAIQNFANDQILVNE